MAGSCPTAVRGSCPTRACHRHLRHEQRAQVSVVSPSAQWQAHAGPAASHAAHARGWNQQGASHSGSVRTGPAGPRRGRCLCPENPRDPRGARATHQGRRGPADCLWGAVAAPRSAVLIDPSLVVPPPFRQPRGKRRLRQRLMIMVMPDTVTLVGCFRDAWSMLPCVEPPPVIGRMVPDEIACCMPMRSPRESRLMPTKARKGHNRSGQVCIIRSSPKQYGTYGRTHITQPFTS